MIVMNKYELHTYILLNWEREWDHETRYFIILQNGDTLGYDFDVEAFYLNNYWNEISCDEALELLQLLA